MSRPQYNYQHTLRRDRAMAAMPDGTQCPECGRPMFKKAARNWDGRALHLDHIEPVSQGGAPNGPVRLLHGSCNQSLGGRIGAGIVNARRKGMLWSPGAGAEAPAGPKGTYDRW